MPASRVTSRPLTRYGGFLLGPILVVRGLAEVLGLRAALGVVALCGLTICSAPSQGAWKLKREG
jgi:hypothetical protein